MVTKHRIALAAICVVFGVLFVRTLDYAYVWDDVQEIEESASFDQSLIDGLVLTQTARQDPTSTQLQGVALAYDSYRPLLFATYWFEVRAFGRDPRPMHADNLVIGLLAILVAFATARRLLDTRGALVATGVFALHAIQVEPVAYISGRGDLLSGLLALCALCASLHVVPGGKHRAVWAIAAGLAFAGSLLSKEAYIALPLLVVALTTGPWRPRLYLGGALAIVAIGYLVLREQLVSATSSASLTGAIAGLPGTLLEYGRIVLLPFDLSTERIHATAYAIPGWIVAALVIAAAIALRKRAPPLLVVAAKGGLWFALLLGPATVSVVANHVTADRYAYLPLLGLAIAGVALAQLAIQRWPQTRKWLYGLGGAWAALVLAVSWLQVPVWRDNETLYANAVTMAPDSSEAHYRLGFLDARIGNWDRAFPLLERAIELEPTNVRALNNLGVGYLQRKQWTDAERVLARAVAANPAHVRSWFNLGLAQLQLGKRPDACKSIGQALHINPQYGAAKAAFARECLPTSEAVRRSP